jgi:uncharacterized protein (DUF433 family)
MAKMRSPAIEAANNRDLLAEMVLREGLDRYIVLDPRICHGQPTFRGTRILVADVLEQVSMGMPWADIRKEWYDAISDESISAAIQFARGALLVFSGTSEE